MTRKWGLTVLMAWACASEEKSVEIIPAEGLYILTSVELSDGCEGAIGEPLDVGDTRESHVYVNLPELTIDLTNCAWDGATALCEDPEVLMQGRFNGNSTWLAVSSYQEWTFDDEKTGNATLTYTYACEGSDCPHTDGEPPITVPCSFQEAVAFAWQGSVSD